MSDVSHEFTEDVNDGSMCMCGIPALSHDRYDDPPQLTIEPDTYQSLGGLMG